MAHSSNTADPTPPAGDNRLGREVPIDSRTTADRRVGQDRRTRKVAVATERRTGGERRDGADRRTVRKRSINQYDLSPEAKELAEALSRFRRNHDNRFPTVAQLLGVIRDLGYEKHDGDQ